MAIQVLHHWFVVSFNKLFQVKIGHLFLSTHFLCVLFLSSIILIVGVDCSSHWKPSSLFMSPICWKSRMVSCTVSGMTIESLCATNDSSCASRSSSWLVPDTSLDDFDCWDSYIEHNLTYYNSIYLQLNYCI